jgi:hypothetical protein
MLLPERLPWPATNLSTPARAYLPSAPTTIPWGRQVKTTRFAVNQRCDPMLASVVMYDLVTGRDGEILVSEPIRSNFSSADTLAAAH